jgi:large subunit ribosomal protein L18
MMAKGPSYNVPYRRRREGKTNYKARKRLIMSRLPRLVARKTGKHVIVQLLRPTVNGDEVMTSVHSRELRKSYGWLGDFNNLPSAYLTGLLCGYRAVANGVSEAVFDIGLQTPSRGSCIFGVLKGFLDAGVGVAHDEAVLPDESRIKGQHIADYAEELASDPDVFSRMFSAYLSRGFSPQKTPDHFSSVKEKIASDFGELTEKE